MNSLGEIQNNIRKLPKKDLRKFRDWFDKFENEIWDLQFEDDVKKGRLSKLAEEAKSDFHAGRYTKL